MIIGPLPPSPSDPGVSDSAACCMTVLPVAVVAEVLLGVLGPEAERVGTVGDLGELRVLPGLAGLLDDRLDDALGVVEEPLLHAQHHARAAGEPERVPPRLGGAPALGHVADLV